jgi:D-galacturonate reductase
VRYRRGEPSCPPAPICPLTSLQYTTGWTGSGGSQSDKKIGVVGLVMFDLRRRGKVGKLNMVGTSGGKFPQIREHLKKNIEDVYGLDTSWVSLCRTSVFRV